MSGRSKGGIVPQNTHDYDSAIPSDKPARILAHEDTLAQATSILADIADRRQPLNWFGLATAVTAGILLAVLAVILVMLVASMTVLSSVDLEQETPADTFDESNSTGFGDV
jgi:hypothetical protein